MGCGLHCVRCGAPSTRSSLRRLFCNCADSGRANQLQEALPLLRRSTESGFISPAVRFTRIDSSRYVVNAARAAKTDDPNHAQRVLYVSVSELSRRQQFEVTTFLSAEQTYGADPKSSFLYTR